MDSLYLILLALFLLVIIPRIMQRRRLAAIRHILNRKMRNKENIEMKELAKRFNKLPYNKKIVFVPFETQLESAVSLKKMNENYTGAFYASVNYLAMGRQTFYNVLNLLNGERDFYRFD